VFDQGPFAVRGMQGQVLDGEVGSVHKSDARRGVRLALALPGQELGETIEAIDAGGKLADAVEVIDDHRQGAEDRRKRTGRLDRPSDFEFARDHPPGDDRAGQNDGQETVAVLKQVQPQLDLDQLVEILEGLVEVASDLLRLLGLAAIEGDGFGILADAHQAEAEIGFALELVEVKPDQDLAEDDDGDDGADHGIDDQKTDQRLRNRPQNTGKGDQLQ